MKVVFATKELKKKLSELSGVVEAKTVIQALSCVKLESSTDGKYSLTANDQATSKVVPISIQEGGDFDFFDAALLPNKLRSVLSKLSAEKVSLDFEGNAITVESGAFKATIETISVDQFPPTPDAPTEWQTINLKHLQTLIGRVQYALPEAKNSMVVAAAQIKSNGATLAALGTDGIRLAHAALDGPEQAHKPFDVLIPKTGLDLLKGLTGETIRMAETETNLFFENETVKLFVRKIPAKMPDLSVILNSVREGEINVATDAFKDAVSRAREIADDEPKAKFFIRDRKFVIEVAATGGGSGEEINIGDSDKADFSFQLNLDHVSEFLNTVEAPKVSISISAKKNVAIFQGGEGYRFFLVPYSGK